MKTGAAFWKRMNAPSQHSIQKTFCSSTKGDSYFVSPLVLTTYMFSFYIARMCLTYICISRYDASNVATWMVRRPVILRHPFNRTTSHNGRPCTWDKSSWAAIMCTLWIRLRFLIWIFVFNALCYDSWSNRRFNIHCVTIIDGIMELNEI